MKVGGAVVVVTGGASGIGRALARRFHAEGAAKVVVADLDGDGARTVAAEVDGDAFEVDVSVERDVVRLIDETEARHGPVGLFCANAGVFIEGGVEDGDDVWERAWGVNVMGHVYAARHLVPRMVSRGEGYLLHTASAAGLLSQIGSVTYAVTKHAVVALAEWISITHGSEGIGVSVLCPQAVRTAMTRGQEESVASVDGMLEPEEVAARVIEALSEERFLVLPHPEVATYTQRRAADHDRWLAGMRRLQARYG